MFIASSMEMPRCVVISQGKYEFSVPDNAAVYVCPSRIFPMYHHPLEFEYRSNCLGILGHAQNMCKHLVECEECA